MKAKNEKFRDRGFEIVAVSREEEQVLANFIRQHSIEYGIVKAGAAAAYGVRGIPHGLLLDAEGKVVWRGHPARLTDEMIEEHLGAATGGAAKIDRDLHERLADAVKAFNEGHYGRAATLAEAASRDGDEVLLDVLLDAQYLQALVEKQADRHKSKLAEAREAGNLLKLYETLKEAVEVFEGVEYGDEAKAELETCMKDEAFKNTVNGHKALEELRPRLRDMRPESAREALQRIIDNHPNTPAANEAAELIRRYR